MLTLIDHNMIKHMIMINIIILFDIYFFYNAYLFGLLILFFLKKRTKYVFIVSKLKYSENRWNLKSIINIINTPSLSKMYIIISFTGVHYHNNIMPFNFDGNFYFISDHCICHYDDRLRSRLSVRWIS